MFEYIFIFFYYVCIVWGIQCVKDCGINNLCFVVCCEEYFCGVQNFSCVNEIKMVIILVVEEMVILIDGIVDGFGDGIQNNNGRLGSGVGVFVFGNVYGFVVVVIGLFVGFILFFQRLIIGVVW